MSPGTISLGRLIGVRVTLHWSALLIAVLIGTSIAPAVGGVGAVLGTVGFLVSILAHEFGHALTARRFGIATESIQLWALGGMARLEREPRSAVAEGWIAVAGPLTSVGLAGLAALGWWAGDAAGEPSMLVGLAAWLAVINASLAIFNLLPGAPLDGGRVLKAVRWAIHGDRYRAAREAAKAGIVLGWLVGSLGLLLVLRQQPGVWLMVTGMFITLSARVEIAHADLSERFAGLKVRDLTWFGVAQAGEDMDADSMLWDRRRLGLAGGVAVTDDAGVLQGLVLEEQMWAVPAEQRPWVLLPQLMVPVERLVRVAPDDDLVDVLPRLDPRRPVVTVWQGGRLVGMIPPARLRQRIQGA